MRSLDLAALVSPLSPTRFLAEHWETKPFFAFRNTPDRFADLLGLEDVDAILSESNIAAPFIRLARDGKMLPISDLRAAGPFGHVGMLDRLYEEYRNGATIILQAIQERKASLRRFCQNLSVEFSAAFQVNAYLTPPGERGFAAHYDTHDVFVLQLQGSKRWRIYDEPEFLPTIGEPPSLATNRPRSVIEEFDLRPGELIYLPRGWWHDAAAVDETSLHLTVGIFPMTWGMLALHAMESAISADPRFRESLPPGFAVQDIAEAEAKTLWADLLNELCTELRRPKHFQTAVASARASRQPALEGYILDLTAAPAINLDTLVAPRPGLDASLECDGERVRVHFNGKSIDFPAHIGPALRSLVEAKSDNARSMPGKLDDASRLLLLQRLVEEGLLTVTRKSAIKHDPHRPQVERH